jgi:hypothetical protein
MEKKMKSKLLYLLLVGLFVFSCAGGMSGLKEPEPGKNLLIGAILFENKGYQNRNELYVENLEVAIIGYYEENGKEKLFGKWLFTDKDGYFYIPNVPDGKYALKAIRVNMEGRAYLTIAKDYKSGVDNFQIQGSENVPFSGTHFNTTQSNRIINLKNNYFTIHTNREIHQGAYDRIEAFTAANGEMVARPFVYKHFMEKWPESGWYEHLQKELSKFQ